MAETFLNMFGCISFFFCSTRQNEFICLIYSDPHLRKCLVFEPSRKFVNLEMLSEISSNQLWEKHNLFKDVFIGFSFRGFSLMDVFLPGSTYSRK